MRKLFAILVLSVGFSAAAHGFTGGYYDQFLFTTLGDCADIKSVWFLGTHSWEAAQLGPDSQGRPVQAQLSVQLFPNGHYWAEYEELAIREVLPNRTSFDTLFRKAGLEGSWRVNGTQIELEGLGSGIPSKYTGPSGAQQDAIRFTLTTQIHDVRAVNSVMGIVKTLSNTGPKGVSISEYCGVH